jgi:hypothetical protein
MIFLEQLNELMESNSLVDVRCDDLKADDIRGFILGTSAKLVLIGVAGNDIQNDGYTIIQLEDVTFLRWGTDNLLGWEKALHGPRNDECLKDTDLSSWWGAIEAARRIGPMVTFQRERIDSSTCYISDRFQFSDSLIVGRNISTDGERNGSFALRTDDLTRIDFGGRYESGLHRMLEMA